MARAPNDKVKLAQKLFNNGEKLVDIAKKLDVPEGSVRRWKSVYNWANENNERSDKIANARNKKTSRAIDNKSDYSEAVAKEVEMVMSNPNLTDKQRLFCLYFSKSFNATRSYQKAYGSTYETAMVEGCKALRNPKIVDEIDRLKRGRYARALVSAEDIVEKFIEIAFADVGDYLEFKTENVPVISQSGKVVKVKGSDGVERALSKTVNVLRFKNSNDLDTSILAEVKQGKDGASVKLPDKIKALEWLANNMGMMTEEQKAKVAKLKAETDKITGDNQEIEDLDGIEADIYGD